MTVSGRPSRPTVLLADGVSVGVDVYGSYKVRCEGWSKAFVRVVCDKTHGMFLQGIAQESGDAADLYDGLTKLTSTAISGAATGHGHLVDVAPLYELQILVHNEDVSNAATVTVDVTFVN